MSDPACINCRFFSASTCLRYPPVRVERHGESFGGESLKEFAWEQPEVSAEGWCGEHRPREAKP